MEQNPATTDKYAKAKIEQPVHQWPEFLQKPGGISRQNLHFLKIFESDPQKNQHLIEAIEAGERIQRKVYRLRSDDVRELTKEKYKHAKHISRVSKATIALLYDEETLKHGHYYVDFIGTVDQVKTAEKLIIDTILERYNSLVFPVILMAPSIHVLQVTMPLYKVERIISPNQSKTVTVEMESGVWLSIQNSVNTRDRVLTIYGLPKHIIKALLKIQAAVSKAPLYSRLDNEINELIKEFKYKLEKEMHQLHFGLNVYESVKIEEPNLHLNNAEAAGAQSDTKVYRIRYNDIFKAFGAKLEEMESIQRVSGSKIRILYNLETTPDGQLFLEFAGTVDQVKYGERIVLDKILQKYFCPVYPIILMPRTVGHNKMKLPLNKIKLLMEDKVNHIMSIETLSSTWIEIEKGGSQSDGLVHIYGPVSNVAKAVSLINSEVCEPWETINTEEELDEQFTELNLL